PSPQRTLVNPQLLTVYDRLLERFMPPSFLIDEHGQLVDTFGGVDGFLRVKSRRPTQNLLDMVPDDIRPMISSAVQRVRRELASVSYEAVAIVGDPRRYAIVAEPIR